MNRSAGACALMVVVLSGLWGCSQGPTSRAALVERVRALEEKTARLEDDLRVAISVRDNAKQQLARAEEHIQKLQLVVKERDELKMQLRVRTGERDQIAGQYETFRKSVKEMVGQADASVLRFPDGEPVTVTLTVPQPVSSGQWPAASENQTMQSSSGYGSARLNYQHRD